MDKPHPILGTGIMVFKDEKVLLLKRKAEVGDGKYEFPGGHVEQGELFEDAARREVREESGIEIKNIRFSHFASVLRNNGKRYVGVDFLADWASGEAKVMEPEKATSCGWYDLDNLPQPLYDFTLVAIEAHQTGKKFFDIV